MNCPRTPQCFLSVILPAGAGGTGEGGNPRFFSAPPDPFNGHQQVLSAPNAKGTPLSYSVSPAAQATSIPILDYVTASWPPGLLIPTCFHTEPSNGFYCSQNQPHYTPASLALVRLNLPFFPTLSPLIQISKLLVPSYLRTHQAPPLSRPTHAGPVCLCGCLFLFFRSHPCMSVPFQMLSASLGTCSSVSNGVALTPMLQRKVWHFPATKR